MIILNSGIAIISFKRCEDCKSKSWYGCTDCENIEKAFDEAKVKSRENWEKSIAEDFFNLFFKNCEQTEKRAKQLSKEKAKIFCDKYFKE